MQTFNMHDAKSNLSRLVDAAEAGEEVVIAKSGRPVVRLVAVDKPVRRFGLLKGQGSVAPDFDAPLPDDVLAGFEDR